MKMKSRFWVTLAMASIVAPATAQVRRAGSVVNSPAVVEITLSDGTYITPPASVSVDTSGQVLGTAASPLAVGGRRESFQLATANTAAAPVTLYGGTYVLSQSCTGYGTVTLRYRGADGITMLTMVSKTAADASGGSLLSFAGGAIVDVSLSGTTGCYATLARMP